jgi:transcriptional regulator with XRE-family HTH domain
MLVTERTTLAIELQSVMAAQGATEWSKILDVDRTTVHKWWSGDSVPRGSHLEAIAQATGRRLRFVSDDEEEPAPSWVRELVTRIERKLDLLLATGGIDPTDAEDEAAADRLLAAALAKLADDGQAAAGA